MPSRKRIATFVCLALQVLFNTPKRAFAQEAGWLLTSPPSNYISAVSNSIYGLVACENDGRLWKNPYNGCFISKDLGNSWSPFGLEGRGPADITYYEDTVYAATSYFFDQANGLFTYIDNQWTHTGPNFTTSAISVDKNALYLGGLSHGLWVSHDQGSSWEQKFGDGWTGPSVRTIESSEDITLAALENSTYLTTDYGITWQEVSDLKGKVVNNFAISENEIYTSATEGLYRSVDLGATWNRLDTFPAEIPGKILFYNNTVYAGGKHTDSESSSIYSSLNKGGNWEDTGFILDHYADITDIDWVFSKPFYIFANAASEGVFRYAIPENTAPLPFLGNIWVKVNPYEHYEKIYSFFDHTYPLLGSNYPAEPVNERATTTNFNGFRAADPYLYYSSHNGTDFTLPYGTEIVAPAAGFASYYSCTPCGNTINIDHGNGYQTSYMHLQSSGLYTNSITPKWIETGTVLGKVGMTGNTTGPHLHFEVTYDTNEDGNFSDESPAGKTDPFGWDPVVNTTDPWSTFSWTKNQKEYTGAPSKNLWLNSLPTKSGFSGMPITLTLENRVISFNDQASTPATLISGIQGSPKIPESQRKLQYLENTSLFIEMVNQIGHKIEKLLSPVQIKITIDNTIPTNIDLESLSIYRIDETTMEWSPIPTIVDLANMTLIGETTHLSEFAVFGERIDYQTPTTSIEVNCPTESDWCTQYPEITLFTDAQNSAYYSTNGESDWDEYNAPFTINKDGISRIEFRSVAGSGILEDTHQFVVQVNATGRITKKLTIKQAEFTIL